MAHRESAPDQTATLIAHAAAWSRTMNSTSYRPAVSGDDRSVGRSSGGDQRQQPHAAVRSADADVAQRPTGTDPCPTTAAQGMPSPQRETPSAPPSSARRTPLGRKAADVALRAARYAILAYPGPIGELISHELHSHVDHDEQLDQAAVATRLVLAMQRREARHPLPPTRSGWEHLPAQYMPGSPLHWRYRTPIDDADSSDSEHR